jgi:hypothetical protein
MTMLNKHAITAALAGALMIGTATASFAAPRQVSSYGPGQTFAPAGGQVTAPNFRNGCVSDEGYGRYRDCDSGGAGG